jgi:hypothetical protein
MEAPPPAPRLKQILEPFVQGYTEILDERAKISYFASRRSRTTTYQTLLYQARLDDLRMLLEELESEIALALCADLDGLVDLHLDGAITAHLSRSAKKKVELPDPPTTAREIRSILYRMYRGGSFHPLVFPREVETEFFRVLARSVDLEGMRGKEIAQRARKLVLRHRIDLRETIRQGMEASESLRSLGFVRWSWRRGRVVRRVAYAPASLYDEALRLAGILERAIARRHLVTGHARPRTG